MVTNEYGIDLETAWRLAMEQAKEEAAVSDRPLNWGRVLQIYLSYTRP